MNIRVICVGRTRQKYVSDGTTLFLNRLKHYCKLEWIELDDHALKNATPENHRKAEGEIILRHLQPSDFVVLLDERGEEFTSDALAAWINKRMSSGIRNLILIIGGAYGFSPAVKDRCNQEICLSRLTFPHDLVRLILAEQLYRAFTILKGEKYHHP